LARPPVDVRRACPDDIQDLLGLWDLARQENPRTGRQLAALGPEQVRDALLEAIEGDELPVLLARWEGRPAGLLILRATPSSALFEASALVIEHLYVSRDLRRHGVARALIAAVAAAAERRGAEQVVSGVAPGDRETNRFFARLGFAPIVVRRGVSTTALRRRLLGESRRGALEELLSRRRRSVRARAATASEAVTVPGTRIELGAQATPTLELPVVADESVQPA
jgi:GNAT superfamily N-acetyltransferase